MNMIRAKRVWAYLLALAVVLTGMTCFGAPIARAEEVCYTESIDITPYKEGIAPKPADPAHAGWIFAGWFTDTTCTVAVDRETATGEQYAKFVPSGVLSAKCQVLNDTTSTSDTSKIRFVSTVDNLRYQQVGFKYQIAGGAEKSYTTTQVMKSIVANEGGVAFGYQPTVFDECSQYFITVTMKNIPNHAFATGIRITPFWVTLDGTEVEGVSRFIRVEDHYNKIVNVPVRLCDNAEVAAGLIGVRYNADKYDYVGYDNGTVFDSTKCNDYNGTVYCVGNVDDISKNTPADGLFVNLRFQLKENQTNDGSFEITNMDFCQNTEQFVPVSVVEAAYKAVG